MNEKLRFFFFLSLSTETIKVRLGPAACSAKGLEVAKTNKEAIEEKERKKDQVEQWRRNKEKLGEE